MGNNTKYKKENRFGFTLIELLAVIIILGILMIVAIPSVTNYILKNRKEAYIDIINSYTKSMINIVNSGKYSMYDTNTTYYVHINNIPLENKGDSSFGKFIDAYVVVSYDGDSYEYYWTSLDEANNFISLKEVSSITVDDIKNSLIKKISTRRAVDFKDNIILIDRFGNITETTSTLELTKEEAELCYIYKINDDNNVSLTKYNSNCSKDMEVPSSIDNHTVTKIENYSFRSLDLTSVRLPNTIIEIGSEAFYGNKLTFIDLPSSVKILGVRAFSNNLLTDIPDVTNLTSFGAGAFSNNKFDEDNAFIYKRNSDKTIDYTTIIGYAGSLKDLVIPSERENVKLTTIASNAFRDVSLNSVIIPEGVIYIGSNAFRGCSLTSVVLPSKSLKTIGNTAFAENKLVDIEIPNSVTNLGTRSFNSNNFTDDKAFLYKRTSTGIDYSEIVSYAGGNKFVVIPESKNGVILTSLANWSFFGVGIISIDIPDSVINIGTEALNSNSLPDSNPNRFIYKRTASGIDYSTIIGYAGANRNDVIIPSEANGVKLTTIGSHAFSDTSIKKVLIPEGVINIGSSAFAVCKLTEVTIPSTVTNIGASAFYKVDNYSKQNMLTKIINLTNRSFDWKNITGGIKNATFVTGTIVHPFGNIEVKSS